MFVRLRLVSCRSLAAILLVGGAACAEKGANAGRDSSADRTAAETPEAMFRAQLGRTWELARLGNQDIPAPRPGSGTPEPGRHPGPGSRPTIRFTAELATTLSGGSGALQAGGWSFCNGYGTAYEVGPGNQLRFHQFESTLVGCNGPDSLETRFFRALHDTERFTLDSTALALIAADGSRLTFVTPPDPVRSPSMTADLDRAARNAVGFLRGVVPFDSLALADTVELRVAPEGGGAVSRVGRDALRDRSAWTVAGRRRYSLIPPAGYTTLSTKVGRHFNCREQSLATRAPDLASRPHVGVHLQPDNAQGCLQSWNATFVFDTAGGKARLTAVLYDQWEW